MAHDAWEGLSTCPWFFVPNEKETLCLVVDVGRNFGHREVSEEAIYSILDEEGQRLLSRNTRHCLEYVLKHSKRSLEPYETLQILPRQKYDCAINAVFCYASPFPLTAQSIQKLRSHHHHQIHPLMANIINDLWTRREISDLCQEQHGWWAKTTERRRASIVR